jgi:hypothetical protein
MNTSLKRNNRRKKKKEKRRTNGGRMKNTNVNYSTNIKTNNKPSSLFDPK